MSTEKALQGWMRNKLLEHDVVCYKFSSPGNAGVPDLLCLHKGRAFFIEVKSPKGTGRLTVLQLAQIKRIQFQGIEVYVVSNKQDFFDKVLPGVQS
jgi:hypothetical protein